MDASSPNKYGKLLSFYLLRLEKTMFMANMNQFEYSQSRMATNVYLCLSQHLQEYKIRKIYIYIYIYSTDDTQTYILYIYNYKYNYKYKYKYKYK